MLLLGEIRTRDRHHRGKHEQFLTDSVIVTTWSGHLLRCVAGFSLNVAWSDAMSPTVSRAGRSYVYGSARVPRLSARVPRLVEYLVPSCSDEPSMVMAFVAVMQGGNS